MARVIVVSNRLPVTVKQGASGPEISRSSGGLATGLKSVHEQRGGLWVGWPGFAGAPDPAHAAQLEARYSELSVVPVTLSADEVQRYYETTCSGVLWPLLHGFPAQLPLEVPDFSLYEAVNQRFADAVVALWQPGDLIWVHDYQLMRVPKLLRDALPDARIGFFLHVPFPDSDTFRILPAREALLDGVLAADLVGFHTAAYARHFASSALHVLGADAGVDGVTFQGRHTSLGVFPMGVDAKAFQALAESEAVRAQMVAVQPEPSVRLFVGIDRLDYTKGIPRRLLAYERLLERHPELRERVRLVQVAVPSRTAVDAYADFRDTVDSLVGRINGRFGTPSWAPVHYVYRNLSEVEVVALYRLADVMVVTPIRDGMNLVAKEFVASRSDGRGVLVLSEFAGAAAELAEAVHVNPYDLDGVAKAMLRCLEMGDDERATRMTTLRHRVFSYDVERWAKTFLERLEREGVENRKSLLTPTPKRALEVTVEAMKAGAPLVLLLDYDGTLVPTRSVPDLATPDAEVVTLLTQLAARPSTQVHVVSGRSRDSLEQWLGHLTIGLHAEHGFWSRTPGGAWVGHHPLDDGWRPHALEVLQDFEARTPGSLVEQKRSGLAFHYRMADREFGPRQANELKLHLAALFSNAPVEVLAGDMVVELRPHGAHKGQVVGRLAEVAGAGTVFAAFGDDRTDEDLFKSLPTGSIAVHVGQGTSIAPVRVGTVREVRAMLGKLLG
ncbi:MAG: bifunctional alpha,alpha-trehalose-phosphate synthase (UDP-forming)/trehalose-phosphatase [Myxococcales bacterium]|nr:bifunctional alpha,alpha-trehalose-phosphate synthase (UDP-forming)/trehalose-phosphatase [Myxococcales bacterium]